MKISVMVGGSGGLIEIKEILSYPQTTYHLKVESSPKPPSTSKKHAKNLIKRGCFDEVFILRGEK